MSGEELDEEDAQSGLKLNWHYERRIAMTPKRMLTIGGVWYIVEGIAGFFTRFSFDFMTSGFSILCISLGLLFWLARNELVSRLRTSIFIVGFVATLGISLIGFYAQWSGRFMESALGYISPIIWLVVSVGFLVVGMDNTSTRIRRLN
jgi:hypothetical protein